MWLYHRVMSRKDADEMAKSVDPDQTAPLGAVWSGSTLFAQAYLSENLRTSRYCLQWQWKCFKYTSTYMLRLNRPVPVILPMVGKIAVQTGKECMTRIKPAVQSYEQRQYVTIHITMNLIPRRHFWTKLQDKKVRSSDTVHLISWGQ